MSNYQLMSGIRRLSDRINLTTDKNDFYRDYIDVQTKNDNLKNNIALIIVKLIEAVSIPDLRTVEKFEEYLTDYNLRNGTSFSVSQFIYKEWLRIIFDSIEFPAIIRQGIRNLQSGKIDQIPSNFLDEIKCLAEFHELATIRNIIIEEENLLKILSLEERNLLLHRNILHSETEGQFFVLANDSFNYLRNEICAILWDLLVLKIQDKTQCLKRFVNIIANFKIYWPDKLFEYLDQNQLKILHDESLKILLSENDLLNTGNEYEKIWLDAHIQSGHKFMHEVPNLTISGDSSYELLCDILDRKQTNYWLYQEEDSVRLKYGILIDIIFQTLKIEHKYSNLPSIPTIFQLLNEIKRPYLVIHSYLEIKDYYQHFIPFLLLDYRTCTIPFMLLNEIKIRENATETSIMDAENDKRKENQIRTQFFKSLFDLFLERLSFEQNFEEESIRQLFNVLKDQVDNFYFNTTYTNQYNHQEESNRFHYLIKALTEKRLSGNFIGTIRPRLYPKVLNGLMKCLVEFNVIDNKKGILFNCIDFELHYQLLILSKATFFENEIDENSIDELNNTKRLVVVKWFKLVSDYFMQCKIDFFENEANRNETRAIYRVSDPSSIEILNWGHFWAFMNENGLVNNLIENFETSLIFEDTDEREFSDLNQDSKTKLVVFLKGISLGIIQVTNSKLEFSSLFQGIDSLLEVLQKKLREYTLKYCITDLNKNRINVFDDRIVTLNSNIHYDSIIRLVFIAINKSEEGSRKDFYDELLKLNHDLLFLLSILNLSNYTNISNLISDKIKEIDETSFINNVSHSEQWKKAVIESLNSSSHYEIATPIINRIETWLEKVPSLKPQYSYLIYRAKLMLSFRRKDIEQISRVEIPEQHLRDNFRRSRAEDLKQFYSALHWGYNEKEFQKAIDIFRQLSSNVINSSDYAYHIYHLETMKYIKGSDSESLFQVKTEWDQFIDGASSDVKKEMTLIQKNIEYTSLFHYCNSKDYYNIDILVQKLPEILKYDEDIVPYLFESYRERDLSVTASAYLRSLESYYSKINEPVPEVVNNLRETINDEKLIGDLKSAYNEIYALGYKDLPKIIPRALNGKSNLPEFIFDELVSAGLILLEKIKSIDQITWENKYNDLLLACLRLRFAVWNWSITDQPRAGESKSGGGDLGSLDFLISSPKNSIALIEAMILESGNKAKTKEHITKCFTYLNHSKYHFVIVYFKGPKDNFESSWEAYKENVLNIDYSTDQKLISEFNDTTKQTDKLNILTGITKHVNDVVLYHLYLNISATQ